MEDTMCDMSNRDEPSLHAKITLLSIELEKVKQAHEKEIAELKRNSDLVLCEMRKSMEKEKTRISNEIRKQCELERLRCIEEAKRKQWCSNCGREAQFYCCWNTSYCDYPCQQQHWSRHATACAQTRDTSASTTNLAAIGNPQSALSETSSKSTHTSNAEVRKKTPTVNTSAGSMNINIHYNKKNISSSVGSMTLANKNSINTVISQVNSVRTDALKLSTNTYPKSVVNNISDSDSNTNSRSLGLNSAGPSYFNVSLPITTPITSNSPCEIVQHGNNWELLNNSNNISAMNTISTLASMQSSGTSLTMTSNPQHQQKTAMNPSIAFHGSGRKRGNPNINDNVLAGKK